MEFGRKTPSAICTSLYNFIQLFITLVNVMLMCLTGAVTTQLKYYIDNSVRTWFSGKSGQNDADKNRRRTVLFPRIPKIRFCMLGIIFLEMIYDVIRIDSIQVRY